MRPFPYVVNDNPSRPLRGGTLWGDYFGEVIISNGGSDGKQDGKQNDNYVYIAVYRGFIGRYGSSQKKHQNHGEVYLRHLCHWYTRNLGPYCWELFFGVKHKQLHTSCIMGIQSLQIFVTNLRKYCWGCQHPLMRLRKVYDESMMHKPFRA